MTVEWSDLKGYIGVGNDDENDFIESCFDHAQTLLLTVTANAFRPVPEGIMDRMTLEVGNELYNRKNAPSGGSQFATFDGGSLPVRGPRDPLSQVRPILALYVVGF